MENTTVMQEFFKGAGEFIRAFWHGAARQGFTIMLLLMGAIFSWQRTSSAESRFEKKILDLEMRQDTQNKTWAEALNAARVDFIECDLKRQELAIKVAELTVMVRKMKR